jgi:hypothetical protein
VIGAEKRFGPGCGSGHGGAHLPGTVGAACCMTNAFGVRELEASVPVKAPSGFAIAFLNTYVREVGGDADGNLPMRYTVTQLAGLTLERDVTVRVDYHTLPNESAHLHICWEPDASLFPSFQGTLHADATGERTCTLHIAGTYEVPGGMAGQLFDNVIGVRIAHGSLEQLLEQFREAIENDYKKRMEYA